MHLASLIGNALVVVLGFAMLAVAKKGFSSEGIPLTASRRITGRTGQCTGLAIGLCGVLSIYVGGAMLVLRVIQLFIPVGAGT